MRLIIVGGLPDSKGALGIAVTIPTPACTHKTAKERISGKDTKKRLPVCGFSLPTATDSRFPLLSFDSLTQRTEKPFERLLV
jgi:hypothetical protein